MSYRTDTERGGRTAIHRKAPSLPLRVLLEMGLLPRVKLPELAEDCEATSTECAQLNRILDYGCGRGADVEHLRDLHYNVDGWDPNHHDHVHVFAYQYDVVLCTYVLNVLPPRWQVDLIGQVLERLKPGGVAYITVRADVKGAGPSPSGRTYQRDVRLPLPVVINASGRTRDFRTYKLEAPHAN